MAEPAHLEIATVQRIWDRYCSSGDPGYLRDLPRMIADSWQRSLHSGVDPGLERFPVDERPPLLDEDEQVLLRQCKSAIAPLRSELLESQALFAVIGRSGRILYRFGSPQVLREADRIGSVPFAQTLESLAGTNSAGSSLHLGQATTVVRWQHFCRAFWSWSDIGVPIRDPLDGEVLGMVDIGLAREALSAAVPLAAKSIADNIQRGLLLERTRSQHDVLKAWSTAVPRQGISRLAIDRRGRILCADHALLTTLGDARGKLGEAHGPRLGELPALHAIATEVASCAAASYRTVLGERETLVDVEPVLSGTGIAGALVRLAPVRTRAARSGWGARHSFDEIIGDSDDLQRVLRIARRAARTDLAVLITGETGTGKEWLAQAIHRASERADGPFVAVNCGAIPQELIASEMFGYERGAFTGASRHGQRGKFELAQGGTLFLDEITETSPAFQVALLRALQEGAVLPLGADRSRAVDVRILSATNRDPEQAVTAGLLRADLFYRLNGTLLQLPPLRERRADIPALIRHFCRLSGRDIEVSGAALERLTAWHWPGNLRELAAVVRSAAQLAEGAVIDCEDLPARFTTPCAVACEDACRADLPVSLKALEDSAIRRALDAFGGNVTQAARQLGMGRSSLYRKVKNMRLADESS